ncbi:Phage protein D OS=Streptomyces microflavus OX=1919 GN=Smic_48880 PE=4 SV=1 [Streptomyces microflavus]
MQFQAGTFDSYLDHRILSQDLTVTGLDQFDIARTLVAHAQEQPGGDIGISLGP